MFYTILIRIVQFLLILLNGKTTVLNKAKLPTDKPYILIAPHRSWLDPVYLAISAYPQKFSFMAKKELFNNPILRFIITRLNAFPVDRDNPGPSAVKTPVNHLKNGELGLVIFPSGTRHSDEAKDGAAMIARLAKAPIVPVVYQGPLTFSQLLKRKKAFVNFGDSIYIRTKEDQQLFSQSVNTLFDQLDKEINPDFHWHPTSKKD